MSEIRRVPPDQVREKVKSGSVLLVCAYEEDEKFRKYRIDGSISLRDFRSRLPDLSKDKEIIFYCA
jgi:rhodanese-related sulfurtransferase